MSKEQITEQPTDDEGIRRGSIHAAHDMSVPEGLVSYVEGELTSGKNVYIDSHGNITTGIAYEIPQVPGIKQAIPMMEGEVISVR